MYIYTYPTLTLSSRQQRRRYVCEYVNPTERARRVAVHLESVALPHARAQRAPEGGVALGVEGRMHRFGLCTDRSFHRNYADCDPSHTRVLGAHHREAWPCGLRGTHVSG